MKELSWHFLVTLELFLCLSTSHYIISIRYYFFFAVCCFFPAQHFDSIRNCNSLYGHFPINLSNKKKKKNFAAINRIRFIFTLKHRKSSCDCENFFAIFRRNFKRKIWRKNYFYTKRKTNRKSLRKKLY